MADILVIDDKADIRDLISEILADESRYKILTAHNVKTAIEHLANHPKVIILDIWLEGSEMDGIGLLKLIKQRIPKAQVIMISGHGNIEVAVKTIKLGAYDFIEKPFKTAKLLLMVERAMDKYFLLNAKSSSDESHIDIKISGVSKKIEKIRNMARNIATHANSRVIITGQNGSGKTTIARFIHLHSTRKERPFLQWYVRHKSPDSLMTELLGNKGSRSILSQVDGGTLLINDFISMPLEVQAAFLQTIKNACVESDGMRYNFDVRIIAATSEDPSSAVLMGLLHDELYHNLNIHRIHMPKLTERRNDIEPLILDYIKHFGQIYNGNFVIEEKLLQHLKAYSWPCNIRQLKNAIECMMIIAHSENKTVLSSEMLPAQIINQDSTVLKDTNDELSLLNLPIKEARDVFERNYIHSQLDKFNWNIAKTAEFIGMDRSALHRKIAILQNRQNDAK